VATLSARDVASNAWRKQLVRPATTLGRRQATAPQVILVVIAILGSSGETHEIGSKATRENFFTADALHADLMDKKVKILACTE
jgi:hypothetical protein